MQPRRRTPRPADGRRLKNPRKYRKSDGCGCPPALESEWMHSAVQVIVYLAGFVLELLAIAGMLRGPYRRYPFLFAYIIADFLTAVVEAKTAVSSYLGNRNAGFD